MKTPSGIATRVVVVALVAGLGVLALLSGAIAVNLIALATLCVLALTLQVLVGYARDTKTIAETSVKQVVAVHEQREREDKRALGVVALLLFEYARGLPAQTGERPHEQYGWGLLIKIAETILTIESKAFIPVCTEIAQFVIQAGITHGREEAIRLFGVAAALANPALMAAYYRAEEKRAASSKGPSSLGGASTAT